MKGDVKKIKKGSTLGQDFAMYKIIKWLIMSEDLSEPEISPNPRQHSWLRSGFGQAIHRGWTPVANRCVKNAKSH